MSSRDYARELAAHPRWTWQSGMVTRAGSVIGNNTAPKRAGYVPDLDHPATKGWLLHMLREATGTQDACASWAGGEWRLYGWIGASAVGWHPTEDDALAAALLAVWGAS